MIRLTGVKKGYGGRLVLEIPRLEIPAGAQRVITGTSGSGKTTLLNLIGGLAVPDAGEVEVAGQALHRMSEVERDRFRARHVGFVFQTFNLLPGFTALENVLLGMLFAGRPDRARAEASLERVGLGAERGRLPGELSVGQQQRVAIARAVVHRPQVLLADEPTGNLDPRTGDSIVELLKDVCREAGTTLVLVTHQPHVMERFKDVVDLSCISGPSSGAISPVGA
ncbi:MAG TPA: ABC transporter ATP-binding protein [Planctomycetota bacterium]|jgi:putative ABC transport system ATP-binding protein|nr:ABC transporter ATP-binding protein [Planctomycetota bacterium]